MDGVRSGSLIDSLSRALAIRAHLFTPLRNPASMDGFSRRPLRHETENVRQGFRGPSRAYNERNDAVAVDESKELRIRLLKVISRY